MIITCPHCRTRYRVAPDAISAAGRQVQCATCSEAWLATPSLPVPDKPDPEPSADEIAFASDDDTLFTENDEALLDNAFSRHAPPDLPADPEPDESGPPAHAPAHAPGEAQLAAARRKALARRRRKIDSTMPLARFRRTSRITATLALLGVLAIVFGLRTELVRTFPELGGLYAAVGLGTNVVGLDFSEVRTLKTTRDGIDVLMVTATLANVTNRGVDVPPVLVSLVSGDGTVIYEWSVTPAARQVPVGGTTDLETRLTAPPAGIESVRLTFAYGQNRAGAEA